MDGELAKNPSNLVRNLWADGVRGSWVIHVEIQAVFGVVAASVVAAAASVVATRLAAFLVAADRSTDSVASTSVSSTSTTVSFPFKLRRDKLWPAPENKSAVASTRETRARIF